MPRAREQSSTVVGRRHIRISRHKLNRVIADPCTSVRPLARPTCTATEYALKSPLHMHAYVSCSVALCRLRVMSHAQPSMCQGGQHAPMLVSWSDQKIGTYCWWLGRNESGARAAPRCFSARNAAAGLVALSARRLSTVYACEGNGLAACSSGWRAPCGGRRNGSRLSSSSRVGREWPGRRS